MKTLPYRVTLLLIGGVCIENKYFLTSKEAFDYAVELNIEYKLILKQQVVLTIEALTNKSI